MGEQFQAQLDQFYHRCHRIATRFVVLVNKHFCLANINVETMIFAEKAVYGLEWGFIDGRVTPIKQNIRRPFTDRCSRSVG